MSLPISVCPRETITLPGGGELEIRGLSRGEAIQMRGLMANPQAVEIASIRYATGETEAAVTAWCQEARNDDVEFLVDAIARLSGLSADVGKDDAGDSLSAKSTASTTS